MPGANISAVPCERRSARVVWLASNVPLRSGWKTSQSRWTTAPAKNRRTGQDVCGGESAGKGAVGKIGMRMLPDSKRDRQRSGDQHDAARSRSRIDQTAIVAKSVEAVDHRRPQNDVANRRGGQE